MPPVRLVRKITEQFFHAKSQPRAPSYIVRRYPNTLIQAFLPCQEIGDEKSVMRQKSVMSHLIVACLG